MSKYDSLFENGYYIGDLEEIGVNMNEFNQICNEVYSIASNNMEENFKYQHLISDLPHRINVSEIEERKLYVKNNPEISVISSCYLLNNNINTKHLYYYFKNVVINFIPNVFPNLNKDNITIHDSIQMYQDGDYQNAHTDGHVGECVVIIYFSNPSKYNNTGKLEFLEGSFPENVVIDSVNPILGKFSILELTNHNIRHRVQIVMGDFIRFSFLGQIGRLG